MDFQYLSDSRRRLQPPGPPPDDGSDDSSGPPDGGSSSGGDSSSSDSGGVEYNGTAAGIAFSGGYIFNALAGGNTDAVEGELDTLDVCLNHPTPSAQFHYHYWTACAVKNYGFWSDTDAPELCVDVDDCMNNTAIH